MYPPHSQPPTGGGNTFGTPQSSSMQQGVFVPPGQPEPEPVKQGLSKGTKIALIILGLLLTLVVMFAVGFAAGQLSKRNDDAGESTPDAASATHMAKANPDTQWPARDTTAPLRPLEPDEPEIYTQPGFDVWDPCDMPPELEQRLHLSNKGTDQGLGSPDGKSCAWTVSYPGTTEADLLVRLTTSPAANALGKSLKPAESFPRLRDVGWQLHVTEPDAACVAAVKTDRGLLLLWMDRPSYKNSPLDNCDPVVDTTYALTGVG